MGEEIHMERHYLHGIVNEEFKRPDRKLVQEFAKLSVASVSGAMHGMGLMHWEIKPISQGMRVCGPASTVLTWQGQALWLQRMADVNQEGDVVVVDASGVKDLSVIGERIGFYMWDKKHIAGVVVDGAVRDSAGFRDMGMPVFAKGICARLFGSIGAGALNVTIECGGVVVNPGDLILGDDDGVIAIPQEKMEEVLENVKIYTRNLEHKLHQMGISEYSL